MPRHVLLALSVLVICGRISAVQAASDLSAGPLSTARLIAAPAPAGGSWTIGVAITLKPKAITYWRDPGEAGVPPTFDFGASTNVAHTKVAYPIPKHLHEGDIDAIGYEGDVVFPVAVTQANPEQESVIRLKLDYATCERICMPAHADLTLALPPLAQSIDAARIAQALTQVPRVIDGAAIERVADVTTEKSEGSIAWLVTPKTQGPETHLFVEAPEGFFMTTKREGDRFRVVVAEHPAGEPAPGSLRLTLARPAGAVEFTVPTD